MTITPIAEHATEQDYDTLVADIKSYIDVLGADHPLHPTIATNTSTAGKPRVNFTITKKTKSNYSQTETVNYVLGDKDGTWEKLVEWRRRLNIESQRHQANLARAAHILKKIGIDDITWVVQVAVPRKLFKGVQYQEEA